MDSPFLVVINFLWLNLLLKLFKRVVLTFLSMSLRNPEEDEANAFKNDKNFA